MHPALTDTSQKVRQPFKAAGVSITCWFCSCSTSLGVNARLGRLADKTPHVRQSPQVAHRSERNPRKKDSESCPFCFYRSKEGDEVARKPEGCGEPCKGAPQPERGMGKTPQGLSPKNRRRSRPEPSEARLKCPLSLGRWGYDLRKNLLIALRNRKRKIACALRVFVASRGVRVKPGKGFGENPAGVVPIGLPSEAREA